jgi:hypothetical protein
LSFFRSTFLQGINETDKYIVRNRDTAKVIPVMITVRLAKVTKILQNGNANIDENMIMRLTVMDLILP